MNEAHYDPTPETPYLRSDCDGHHCETMSQSGRKVGLGGGRSHHHHHGHHKQKETEASTSYAYTPSLPYLSLADRDRDTGRGKPQGSPKPTLPPSPLRLRNPSTSSHGSRTSNMSLFTKAGTQWSKFEQTLDINNPLRTDYTYSHSSTYRRNTPTPEWLNPKMSRRSLHGTTFFKRSTSAGISIWNWISYYILQRRRRVVEVMDESSDEDTTHPPLPNGHIEDTPPSTITSRHAHDESSGLTGLDNSSPRKHQFRFFTSTIGSVFWVVSWVLSTISYSLHWPLQKIQELAGWRKEEEEVRQTLLHNNISWSEETEVDGWETDDPRRTAKEPKKRGCCGPVFCCIVLPLFLLLLGLAAWNNDDSREFIQLYVFPLSASFYNITRERISHYFHGDSASASHKLNTPNVVTVASEVSKDDFLKLEQRLADMETRLGGILGKCCKDQDVSAFLPRSEFDLMLDENGDLRKLRADVVFVKEQLRVMSADLESGKSNVDKEVLKLKQDFMGIQKLMGGLATKSEASNVPSEVMEELGRISGLVSRLAILEVMVAEVKQSSGTLTPGDVDGRIRSKEEELTSLISQQRKELEASWMAEVKGLMGSLKKQETQLGDLKMAQGSLSVALEGKIKREVEKGRMEGGVSMKDVNGLIAAAIATYDMDKTGMADHALEPAGGSVLSVRCSETYSPRTRKESILGIPMWYSNYSPRTVIQPGVVPGECWAFKGSSGFLVLQLSGWINVSGFSYEHIPKVMSPDGHIESAPREFQVWGLKSENDPEAVLMGKYVYDQNGQPFQHFPVQTKDVGAVPVVELKILSNHGNPVYTCLYRFRVHGKRFKPAYGME